MRYREYTLNARAEADAAAGQLRALEVRARSVTASERRQIDRELDDLQVEVERLARLAERAEAIDEGAHLDPEVGV